MKTLRFEGALCLSDVPIPEPGAGQGLVRAIDLLASQILNVAPLIQGMLPFSSGVEAFARAEAPGSRKILLDPSP